jgi:hypothetical protein
VCPSDAVRSVEKVMMTITLNGKQIEAVKVDEPLRG